jgi:hypothetical protein
MSLNGLKRKSPRDAMFTYEYEYFRVTKEVSGSMRLGASDCRWRPDECSSLVLCC